MWATTESAVRRPTPLRPLSRRDPRGAEDVVDAGNVVQHFVEDEDVQLFVFAT